jgi:hypothetical protein
MELWYFVRLKQTALIFYITAPCSTTRFYIFKITPEQILADKKLAYSKKPTSPAAQHGSISSLSEATIRHQLNTYLHWALQIHKQR